MPTAVKENFFYTNKSLINAILTNDKIAEDEKSELIANMISEFKTEYPELKYHATKQDVTETELRLTKEIENTRKEIKELDLKLTKEIENTRKEIKETKVSMIKWSFIFWISQMSALMGIGFFVFKALNMK
jgi:molecular chaperone GrpE (heat shock protein)